MNEKNIFSFYPRKIYNIVQQHFWHKYSFQRVPNQADSGGVAEGVDKHPLE